MHRQILQSDAFSGAESDDLRAERVGVAEGQTLHDQVIGQVRRVEIALLRGFAHGVRVEFERSNHRRRRVQTEDGRIHRVKDGLLVLLHIFVIGQGQALEHDQGADEVAVHAPRLAADQFRQVRVALLGHDAGAGGIAAAHAREAELAARPEDQLLRQAGEVRHQDGQRALRFKAEITVRYGVQAVLAGAGEAQGFRGVRAVDRIGRSGQGAAAKGGKVHARGGIPEAAPVAQEHHGIGHHVLPQALGLRVLQVGHAGHQGGSVLIRDLQQRVQQPVDPVGDLLRFGAQPQPKVQRDLVIAASRGVQHPARRADAPGQLKLDKAVDILALLIDRQPAVFNVPADALQALRDTLCGFRRDDPLAAQHGGMDQGALYILTPQAPVDGDRAVEGYRLRGQSALQGAFPKASLLRHSRASVSAAPAP